MHATQIHIDGGNTFAYLDLHPSDLLVYPIHGKISTFTCKYEWYVFLNVFPQQVKFLANIFYDISFDQHFQIRTLFMFILHMKFLHDTPCISFHKRWNVWYIQLLFELISLQHWLLKILLVVSKDIYVASYSLPILFASTSSLLSAWWYILVNSRTLFLSERKFM